MACSSRSTKDLAFLRRIHMYITQGFTSFVVIAAAVAVTSSSVRKYYDARRCQRNAERCESTWDRQPDQATSQTISTRVRAHAPDGMS